MRDELRLLRNKKEKTRLCFGLLLKYLAWKGRWPRGRSELPDNAIEHVARQVKVPAEELGFYDWDGRTIQGPPSRDPPAPGLPGVHRRGRRQADRLAGRARLPARTPARTGPGRAAGAPVGRADHPAGQDPAGADHRLSAPPGRADPDPAGCRSDPG